MIRPWLAASAVLALLGACSKAADESVAAKDTSAIADIQIVTSPGGVTAWLVSDSFVPMISMEMAWKGGSAVEPAGKEGLGWVLSYMMNEGAGELDTTAYGERMADLNMKFACGPMADWAECGMVTLRETMDESFDMLRLAFEQPRFDQEPIDRAKKELSIGLKRAEADPKTMSHRTMMQVVTPGHAYSRYATPETVSTITRDDVAAFMKSQMTRDRLIVVVVGDISAEELKPKLDEVFASLPAASTLPDVPDVKPVETPAEPVVKTLPIPQTLVTFSGPGLKRSNPDFYAAYVLNYILGGGFSSRLTDDIREKRGLTYGIGSELTVYKHLARWSGSGSTMNDKAGEVVKLVKEHIATLGTEGPTEKELAVAKAYLTGAFPLSFDSNKKIASNLMSFRQDDLGVDYVAQRNDIINAVTMEDVKRVAAAYMRPENFTFVLVGQPK